MQHRASYTELIRQQFAFARNKKIRPLGAGFNSVVYGIGSQALKLIESHTGYEPGATLMKREARALTLLGGLSNIPIPVPQLIKSGTFGKTSEFYKQGVVAWTLTTRLSGRATSFSELMRHPKAVGDLGRFTAFLHGHTSKSRMIGGRYIRVQKSIKEILQNVKNKNDERLARDLAARVRTLPRENLALIHGDINASNILIRNGRISGIVDFAEMNYDLREFDWCHAMLNPRFASIFKRSYYYYGGQTLDLYYLHLMSAVNQLWNVLADESVGNRAAARKDRRKLQPLLTKLGIRIT